MMTNPVQLTTDQAGRIGETLLVMAAATEQRIVTGYYGWTDLPREMADEIANDRDLARICGVDMNRDGALVRRQVEG